MSKLAVLRETLARYERVVVAFSGGVDSAFLLRVALDVLGEQVHAVTAVSPTMAQSKIREAEALARLMGVGDRHHMIESHELEVPGFAENPAHRCALCKTELLDVAAQLTEQEIRELSKQLGLSTWDKPQLACLSSRFPYGTQITPDRLRRVDQFEDGLRALGVRQLRVRFHDTIARLEIERAEMPRALELNAQITALGKKLGFAYVALDLTGFRSGSLNEVLVPLKRAR